MIIRCSTTYPLTGCPYTSLQDRERETERDRDRQTDRQTDRKRDIRASPQASCTHTSAVRALRASKGFRQPLTIPFSLNPTF